MITGLNLTGCSNLEILDVSFTYLDRIGVTDNQVFPNLIRWYASGIGLHDGILPLSFMCNQPRLEIVELGTNRYNGSIPNCEYSSPRLTFVSLHNNLLTGFDPGLYPILEYLDVRHNRIVYDFNSRHVTFGNMKTALFSVNHLSGNPFLGFPSLLSVLYIESNPVTIYSFTIFPPSLVTLNIQYTQSDMNDYKQYDLQVNYNALVNDGIMLCPVLVSVTNPLTIIISHNEIDGLCKPMS